MDKHIDISHSFLEDIIIPSEEIEKENSLALEALEAEYDLWLKHQEKYYDN